MARQTGGITQYRINQLEDKVKDLNDKIELLMTNHLPHLKEDILSLKTRINVMTAINIGGIVLGLIAARLIR